VLVSAAVADGAISGTLGGGKFESLVFDETLATLRDKTPLLKTIRYAKARPIRSVRFVAAKSRSWLNHKI
jgi:xanthine/CO dehydrogenase XdhC/CoxF family maturation factor